MPETLDDVDRLVESIRKFSNLPCALLVVPGRNWTESQIDHVRAWADEGLEIAGHGWLHECTPRGLYHRAHSLLISRNVAEHLSRTEDELRELVDNCCGWFGDHDLPQPRLYVPPAWAMGALSRESLRALPFEMYESLSGVYHSASDQFYRLPLTGYEADTAFRAAMLRTVNYTNRTIAQWLNRPLRVSIHPYDDTHAMASDLQATLDREFHPIAYQDLTRLGIIQADHESIHHTETGESSRLNQ